MTHLPRDIEALALRLAAAQHLPVEVAIRRALEKEALSAGLPPGESGRRRMTLQQVMSFGAEIAALPVRDPRPPSVIMDEVNAL